MYAWMSLSGPWIPVVPPESRVGSSGFFLPGGTEEILEDEGETAGTGNSLYPEQAIGPQVVCFLSVQANSEYELRGKRM